MMRTVYFEGELADQWGEKRTIWAPTPADVFRCLKANFSNFTQYCLELQEKQVGVTIHLDNQPLQQDEDLLLNLKGNEMIVSPMPIGASGAVKIIVGVALVVITGGAALAAYAEGSMLLAAAYGAAAGLGFGLIMSGLMDLMAPDPATDNQAEQEDESYLFQGSEHNIKEGYPVPLLYGRLRIPGRPISFGIRHTTGTKGSGTSYQTAPGNHSTGGGGGSSPLDVVDAGIPNIDPLEEKADDWDTVDLSGLPSL
ncbi:MAG: hypothetical protein CMK29_02015 [Porticoccaceae bacterium]|nr:hypothetical protein [Porticoccaceae bacterium]